MRDPLAVPVTRRGKVFDLVVALVYAAVALPVHWTQSIPAGVAATLVAVALVFRRSRPTLMIALAIASAIVQVVYDDIAVLASLAYALLAYTLGGHPDKRVRFASLAAALVGACVAAWEIPVVYSPSNPDYNVHDPFSLALGFAVTTLVVAGGWALGFIGYQRRSVEQSRVAETINALERRRVLDLYEEQKERTRLAREMHDVVAHSLAVVIAQAEGGRYALDANPDTARQALGVIAGTAREALTDVRELLTQLRSDDTALESAQIDTEQLFARMRNAGMILEVSEAGHRDERGETSAHAVFRILTESLTNALKYGDLSTSVVVDLDWRRGCRLSVTNALTDTPLAPGGAGQGVAGMMQRAHLAGGTLAAGPESTNWVVTLVIPAPAATPGDSRDDANRSGDTS